MNKFLIPVLALAALLAVVPAFADKPSHYDDEGNVIESISDNGFDQFGYNYNARIFSGKADGVDRVLDGKVWGDPTYANDHLVMKWSQAWDDARFHGGNWTTDAWENNEWNGNGEGGSGEVWHYKIEYVGASDPVCADPNYEGEGYCVWGSFKTLMDQGTTADKEHVWLAHATPTGYGA
jgi:hypothetical protein